MKPDEPMKTEQPTREGGIWICAALMRNREITDTQKLLVGLVDRLTTSQKPCDRSTSDLARMLVLTTERTDSLLKSLKSRGFVIELSDWGPFKSALPPIL
jgi:hypothetical protein